MAVYKTDAIVIRSRDYSEADKILTLISAEHGKIQAIAKGVRKPKSRLRGGVQLFSRSSFLLHKGKSLDTVSQVEQRESFLWLQNDLERLTYATYLAELVDAAVLENEEGQEIFLLTLACLYLLSSVEPKLVARCFEFRMLHLLGYRPQTENCAVCNKPVMGENRLFSVEMGGVICFACKDRAADAGEISGGALAVLNQLLRIDLRKLDRLKIPIPVNRELSGLSRQFFRLRLEKRFKSLDFLAKLEKE